MDNFYLESISQILKKLHTSSDGLVDEQIKQNQKNFGKNILPKARENTTRLSIFLSQFASPLIIILIIAGIISLVLQETMDTIVIFVTVFVNSVVGFLQEDKANQALKKLSQMVEYKVLVIRKGKTYQIDSKDLVVGDIILFEAGEKIQADARIMESVDLKLDESALTGESESIKKNNKKIKKTLAIADRNNMIYRGTTVVSGRGRAVVVAVGKDTEIGKIASLVKSTKDDRTPLQIQLTKLARIISAVVLFICVIIFVTGLFFDGGLDHWAELFETAVAVAVAAIPEGMAISLTVILAIGMQFILKRRALVRKLVATETLGSVSVICTDKTGTLTEGKMRLTQIFTASQDLDFEEIKLVNQSRKEKYIDSLLALKIAIIANDGIHENPEASEKDWNFVGDTTDTAILYAGMKAGLGKDILEKSFVRLDEIPFDSKKKYMATLNSLPHGQELYLKGASEKIYKMCGFYEENGEQKKMTKKQLEFFKNQENEMTQKGLRVIAVAYKNYTNKNKKSINSKDLKNLTFIGFLAFSDPLRPDVKETLEIASKAGIRTVMITGDHVRTAQAIASDIGIPCKDSQIFDGEKLEAINDEDLRLQIKNIYVFARVEPKHKIRIVNAFQANGEVVAMTGDGVNDAPALKGADIGVALGFGTDVAKEISDMVLLDDKYSTIVSAVEEGRGIYQNIKKIILYLLAGSFSEVILILGSIVAGLPLAALPAQILWVNLIEDTFPNIALAFDKGEKENMLDKPRVRNESIIDNEMRLMIIMKSILANVVLFGIFYYFWKTTGDIKLTRTLVFTGFAIDSLFFIFSIRSLRHMIWHTHPLENKKLLGAVGFGWVMLVLAIYLPPLQALLRTVALSWHHWLIMISFGLFNIVIIETIKVIFLVENRRAVSYKH